MEASSTHKAVKTAHHCYQNTQQPRYKSQRHVSFFYTALSNKIKYEGPKLPSVSSQQALIQHSYLQEEQYPPKDNATARSL